MPAVSVVKTMPDMRAFTRHAPKTLTTTVPAVILPIFRVLVGRRKVPLDEMRLWDRDLELSLRRPEGQLGPWRRSPPTPHRRRWSHGRNRPWNPISSRARSRLAVLVTSTLMWSTSARTVRVVGAAPIVAAPPGGPTPHGLLPGEVLQTHRAPWLLIVGHDFVGDDALMVEVVAEVLAKRPDCRLLHDPLQGWLGLIFRRMPTLAAIVALLSVWRLIPAGAASTLFPGRLRPTGR